MPSTVVAVIVIVIIIVLALITCVIRARAFAGGGGDYAALRRTKRAAPSAMSDAARAMTNVTPHQANEIKTVIRRYAGNAVVMEATRNAPVFSSAGAKSTLDPADVDRLTSVSAANAEAPGASATGASPASTVLYVDPGTQSVRNSSGTVLPQSEFVKQVLAARAADYVALRVPLTFSVAEFSAHLDFPVVVYPIGAEPDPHSAIAFWVLVVGGSMRSPRGGRDENPKSGYGEV